MLIGSRSPICTNERVTGRILRLPVRNTAVHVGAVPAYERYWYRSQQVKRLTRNDSYLNSIYRGSDNVLQIHICVCYSAGQLFLYLFVRARRIGRRVTEYDPFSAGMMSMPTVCCKARTEALSANVKVSTFHAAHARCSAHCVVSAVGEVGAAHITGPFCECIHVGIVDSTSMADQPPRCFAAIDGTGGVGAGTAKLRE